MGDFLLRTATTSSERRQHGSAAGVTQYVGDSFEKARKAFFGTAPTTPNLNSSESETFMARSVARQVMVVERLPFRTMFSNPTETSCRLT